MMIPAEGIFSARPGTGPMCQRSGVMIDELYAVCVAGVGDELEQCVNRFETADEIPPEMQSENDCRFHAGIRRRAGSGENFFLNGGVGKIEILPGDPPADGAMMVHESALSHVSFEWCSFMVGFLLRVRCGTKPSSTSMSGRLV